ncbi:hypothetical protein [Alkalihalobacillus sp. CinArs1]|uniref:hypothetical protein n=1 Tax=Alkalihalobacillus sp. CinArs1 TaxID=2995314 RepID=UPI0022DE5DF0|nr:hypothetical protein [Alkalihalobacillus sp. CinArs1]
MMNMKKLSLNALFKTLILLVSITSIVLISLWRFHYAIDLPRSWDQVDFALALSRFDLYAMQPHFPGYPYFVLGGMVIHKWIGNPSLALSTFNSLILLSSSIPLYFLSRNILSKTISLLIVGVLQSMVFLNVMSIQPMSEAAAVGILWWYIWGLHVAFQRKASSFVLLLPSFLLSILLGIRLSYLPFGIGFILLLISRRSSYTSNKTYALFISVHLFIAICFQLIWVVGLAASEGGITAFLELALGFSSGHFQEWGGSAVSTTSPLWIRSYELVVTNIGWVGLAGQRLYIAAMITIMIIGFILLLNKVSRQSITPFQWTYGIMFALYFLWALFAQNIDKPRHILPLPGMVLFAVLLFTTKYSEGFRAHLVKLGLVMLLLFQSFGTFTMMREAQHPTAVHQLSSFLSEIEEPIMVYTWEETRVMDYLDVHYEHDRVFTYETFLSEIPYYDERRIFLTDRVVKGFEQQGAPIRKSVTKVGAYYSDKMYDPVYHEIVLYEYKR